MEDNNKSHHDSDEDEDEDDHQERRTTPARRPKQDVSYVDDDDDEEEEEEETDDDMEEADEDDRNKSKPPESTTSDVLAEAAAAAAATAPPKKRLGRPPKVKQDARSGTTANSNNNNNNTPDGAKKTPDLTCPHCHKVFSIRSGLQYHVDKKVCLKEKTPAKPTKAAPRKRSKATISGEEDDGDPNGSNPPRKKAKVLNGAEKNNKKDDTPKEKKLVEPCPHCSKNFSTVLGLKYHIDNFVCRKPKKATVSEAATRRPRQVAATASPSAYDGNFTSEDEEDSDDDDSDEAFHPNAAARKRTKSTSTTRRSTPSNKRDSSLSKTGSGDDSGDPAATPPTKRECPHCGKEFTSLYGLNYHLEKKVCMEMGGEGEMRVSKKKKGTAKRNRGSLEHRTCPTCQKVFTSGFGRDYHVDNRVCEQVDAGAKVALPILAPGTEFVTRWGIARVVNDNQAIPTGKVMDASSKDLKHWKLRKTKRETKRISEYKTVNVHSLVRRKRLGRIYKPHREHQSTTTSKDVMSAYFGPQGFMHATGRGFPLVTTAPPNDPSPLEPDDSYPNRMVECVLIPDRRTVYDCYMVPNLEGREFAQTERHEKSLTVESDFPTKMYLQRRELTDKYFEEGVVFICKGCGKTMSSLAGAKYHVTASCGSKRGTKTPESSTAYEQSMSAINHRAEQLMKKQDTNTVSRIEPQLRQQQLARAPMPESAKSNKLHLQQPPVLRPTQAVGGKRKRGDTKRAWTQKKKPILAYYPQVWRSLGFKVLPRKRDMARVSFFEAKERTPGPGLASILRAENMNFEDPNQLDETIMSMKDELYTLRESELGAFYPKVWKFLGFRKPRTPAPESPPRSRSQSPEPEMFIPEPPPFKYPAPASIIDISVLASEVDKGRYPSIKRNGFNEFDPEEDFHEDKCYICKDERGLLYKCDFCPRINHLECIRSRFIVKDPEPHDDFMCNKCIQLILTKRRRAEKRRLDSNRQQGGQHHQLGGDGLEEAEPTNPQQLQLNVEYPEPGKEMEFLARQAKHVEEVLELIRDSQSRLQQLVETSKMNDFRRSMFTES